MVCVVEGKIPDETSIITREAFQQLNVYNIYQLSWRYIVPIRKINPSQHITFTLVFISLLPTLDPIRHVRLVDSGSFASFLCLQFNTSHDIRHITIASTLLIFHFISTKHHLIRLDSTCMLLKDLPLPQFFPNANIASA